MGGYSRRETAIRLVYFVVGSCITAVGGAIFVLCSVGTDPFGVLMQGVARTMGISNGLAHIGINATLIVLILFVDRKYIRIGTFAALFAIGPVIDLASGLLGGVIHAGLPYLVRVALMAASCAGLISLGLAAVINADMGMGGNDLVAVIISDKARWQFRWVRIAVDAAMVLSGMLLGGVAGVGTVFAVLLIGPVAQFFLPPTALLLTRLLRRFADS